MGFQRPRVSTSIFLHEGKVLKSFLTAFTFTDQHRKMIFVRVCGKSGIQFQPVVATGRKLSQFLDSIICVFCSAPYPTGAFLLGL